MLWYGYIYLFIFSIVLFLHIFFFMRLFNINNLFRINIGLIGNRIFMSNILMILFFTFLVLNSLMCFYQNLFFISIYTWNISIDLISMESNFRFLNLTSTSISLIEVYYYPFIYVFLIITILSIIFCLTYNKDELMTFMFYCQLILLAGYALFFTDSIILFFLAYEMLLVPSFFILYKFAKTRRCVEAAYLMFFWTQFGALFLIFALIYLFLITNSSKFSIISYYYFTSFEINFMFVCWLVGFGVKLPIWPFYGWLPKAHVEASTNFSIFLSGVLVKFAFFGLLKCLLTLQLEPTFIYVYPFLVVGVSDAVFKLFYQIDLKKLVAYSTVVEMHWLTICVVSGQSNLLLSSFCMLISHALLSTNSFLLVDAVARRFKTRLITEISGLNFMCPKLFLAILLNTLIFLGFPGSIFFIAEFLFFSFFFNLFPIMACYLILLLYLIGPTFFFRSWMNIMFSYSTALKQTLPIDLTSRESYLFFGLALLMYWLGISWQAFVM